MDNSNTCHDWMIERAYVLVPLQAVASKFLMTLKDFPSSQKAIGDLIRWRGRSKA